MISSARLLASLAFASLVVAATAADSHEKHAKGATAPSAADRAAYPLKTCLVTDEDLDEMGHPVVYTYKEKGKPDRVILLCCQDCAGDFEKEPSKYLKKLDAAAAKARGKK